jgi:branched-chain amino acid transport system substrate-binding protein
MRPTRWAVALLAVMVAVLSGCSSSSTPSGGKTASGAAVDKATGSPYKLGVICSCSGSNAASISTMTSIITAWSASVNAAGGIGNHPIELFTADDSQNPGTALTDVTKMVQQDHVIAIVDLSNVDSSFGTYVEGQHVPVIGGNLDSDLFESNPDFFTAGGTTDAIPLGIIAAAKTAKVDKLGVLYCGGVPICAELPPVLKQLGGPAGVSISYSGAIPNAAPNYTASCLAARQSGADGLFVASGPPQTLAVVESCSAQGYNPTYIAAENSLANSSLSNSAVNGAVGEITNLPASDTSNPEIKAMDQALNQFKPGLLSSAQFNPGSSMVWAAGALFQAAAQAGHLGDNPTPAQVLAGLYDLKNETLGGLTAPLTFTKGKPTSLKCWFYYQVKNGEFTNPFGVSPTCASS